jgi:hypothetical protein
VISAVRKGKFHIYAITTIDEGVELLMNKPAGVRQANGLYPKNTVNWLVMQKVADFAKKAKMFDAKKVSTTQPNK